MARLRDGSPEEGDRPAALAREEAVETGSREALERVSSHTSSYPLTACFTSREVDLLEEIRSLETHLDTAVAHELDAAFERSVAGLGHLVKAMNSCPSVDSAHTFAGRSRDLDSLVDGLCRSDPAGLDLVLPTRAVLGQSFLHAKINFFRALRCVLEAPDRRPDALLGRLNDALGDTLYFKLAEELLVGSISNAANSLELKRAAARLLVQVWEDRLEFPIQDFSRLLLSAWRARRFVQEVFGTLVGFHEIVALLRARCEPRFLEFFSREWVTPDEQEALREFLFGLAHEELQKLKRHMEENDVRTIGPGDAAAILGHPPFHSPTGESTPETVFLSYRRRRIRASYRVLTGQPGPHKTAEGYLMEYYLLHGAEAP